MKKAALYIHIPFCKVKCMYCDFYSITKKEDLIPLFTECLLKEIESYKNYAGKWIFDTIFFGGGTPSLLPAKYLEKILQRLHDTFDTSNVKEVTMEANPGEASLKHLKDIRKLGVNRLSIGFQSFDDKVLGLLGRLHQSKDCFKTFNNARKAGFDNINTDMIFNIPGLSIRNWLKDMNKLLKLKPEHISAYSLTVEPSTKLFNLVKNKELLMPLKKIDIEQFLLTKEILSKNGYKHYEISSYAKDSMECKHNLHYWDLSPYLSFGPSAHSYNLEKRWWNYRSLDKYTETLSNNLIPIKDHESLSKSDNYNETILNGLRLSKGLDLSIIKHQYNKNFEDYINQLQNKWDCIDIKNNSLQLNKNGMLLVDEISSDMFI